jgi:glycosyltransferase involved in cell wall biosynthesis
MTEITVGLPVHNGAQTLARAFDQMQAQTYADFRLVVSDNASTDDTQRICKDYAARDSRIEYHRIDKLIPASENYRGLIMGASTPYFMWISHDDIWLPTFIEKCLGAIRNRPNVVCVVPRSNVIEYDGRRTLDYDTAPLRGTAALRLALFLSKVSNNHRYYGVFRTDALQRSFPVGDWFFAYDWLVVALSTLEGEHEEIPDVLFEKYANPKYHYFRSHTFEARTSLEWLFPCLRFTKELHSRIPLPVWRACLPKLVAINAELLLQSVESFYPWLRRPLGMLRVVARFLGGRVVLTQTLLESKELHQRMASLHAKPGARL